MIIVKGDIGIAFNPKGLEILCRNKKTGANYKAPKAYEDLMKLDEYYIQAVFGESDDILLTSKINTFEEAKDLLDKMYQNIK